MTTALLEEVTGPHEAAEEEEERAARLAELEAGRVGAFLDEDLARLRARVDGREKPIPLPWGNVSRELGGGLWPGCYVLVGNTGSGKSQWALQAAYDAASHDVPVLYVGLELGRLDLSARLVGLATLRKWSRAYLGEAAGRGDLNVLEADHDLMNKLRRMPFHLETAPPHGWAYTELVEAAKAMRSVYPETSPGARPFLIVLDFLQLVAGLEREDLRECIGKAAYAGRAVAREHNAAVLFLSSTARDNYYILSGEAKTTKKAARKAASEGRQVVQQPLGTGNPARLVGLGKESGDVEYATDATLVLAREPWPEDGVPPAGGTTCWLAVAKTRARPDLATGWAKLMFDGSRFTEPGAPKKVSI